MHVYVQNHQYMWLFFELLLCYSGDGLISDFAPFLVWWLLLIFGTNLMRYRVTVELIALVCGYFDLPLCFILVSIKLLGVF